MTDRRKDPLGLERSWWFSKSVVWWTRTTWTLSAEACLKRWCPWGGLLYWWTS